jgi:hypothetical protein
MALTGTLKGFGVSEILQLISQQIKTGSLIITYQKYKIYILFKEGIITGLTDNRWTFDPRAKILFEGGFIDEKDYKAAFNTPKEGDKWAEMIVSQGKLDRHVLDRATNVIVKELFFDLLYKKEGLYRFEDKEYDTSVMFSCSIPTETLILETLQIIDEGPLLAKKIPPLEYHPVAITSLTQETIKKYELTDSDTRLLSLIDGEKNLDAVIKKSLEPSFDVLKSISKLMDASLIEFLPQTKEQGSYISFAWSLLKTSVVYVVLILCIVCLALIGNPRIGPKMFSSPLLKKYVSEQKEIAAQYSIQWIRPSDSDRDNRDR